MDALGLFASLDAKVEHLTRLTWPDTIPSVQVFDFRLGVLTREGHAVSGRGTAFEQSSAIAKAISECIERILFVSKGFEGTTNGWAAHPDRNMAKRNAVMELIERDLYLCHHLTATPYRSLSLNDLRISDHTRALLAYLIQLGLKPLLGLMGDSDVLSPVACAFAILGGTKFGVITTQACGESVGEVAAKAVLEGTRNAVYQLSNPGNLKELSQSEFLSQRYYDPQSHYRFGLCPGSSEFVEKLFQDDQSSARQKASPAQIERTDFALFWENEADGCYVSRAQNPLLQNVFFGPTTAGIVNLQRLREFKNNPSLNFGDVTTRPHTHH